jgi:hypothetical protein
MVSSIRGRDRFKCRWNTGRGSSGAERRGAFTTPVGDGRLATFTATVRAILAQIYWL